MERNEALALLRKYNGEPFHIMHGLTVEAVMRWYANELGYGDEADFWGLVGLLHDVDFENIQNSIVKRHRNCYMKSMPATNSSMPSYAMVTVSART